MTRRKAQQIGRKRIRKGKAIQTRRDVRREAPIPGPSGDAGSDVKVPIGPGKRRREAKQKGRPKAAKVAEPESMESDGSDSSGDTIQEKQLRYCNNIASYENFFKSLQGGMVYVRVSDKKNKLKATEVWFARVGQLYTEGNRYSMTKVQKQIPVYGEMLRNWKLKAESGSKEDVCTMMAIFKEMSECIDSVAGEWEIQHNKVSQYYRKVYDIRDRHMQKNRSGKEYLVQTFLDGRYPRAMEHFMFNSVGRQAVQNLIMSACQCAFGFDYVSKAYVSVHSLGTSRCKEESFPVKDVIIDDGLDFEAGGPKSSGRVSNPGSSTVRADEALEKGEVYPDLLVVEGTEIASKVLMVVEIKKERDLGMYQIQMFREMLGPLLRQNLVFGLLMNAFEAQLYFMERHGKGSNKKIMVHCVNFTIVDNDQISLENFKKFFLNIVSALDFVKGKVKLTSALESK